MLPHLPKQVPQTLRAPEPWSPDGPGANMLTSESQASWAGLRGAPTVHAPVSLDLLF